MGGDPLPSPKITYSSGPGKKKQGISRFLGTTSSYVSGDTNKPTHRRYVSGFRTEQVFVTETKQNSLPLYSAVATPFSIIIHAVEKRDDDVQQHHGGDQLTSSTPATLIPQVIPGISKAPIRTARMSIPHHRRHRDSSRLSLVLPHDGGGGSDGRGKTTAQPPTARK